MKNFERDGQEGGGLRERKKRETRKRITETAISLFLKNGFDHTTLDEIAAAAGIARRTFFYYFTSKDEILLSLQGEIGDTLIEAVRKAPANATPTEAVRSALVRVCESIPSDEMIALDRLMRTSESVKARKQAFYVQQEGEIYEALTERWPDPASATSLRVVAMLSVGALRLAGDMFHQAQGSRPIIDILEEIFRGIDNQERSSIA